MPKTEKSKNKTSARSTKNGEKLSKKKKRPWRQAVRHRAKQLRVASSQNDEGNIVETDGKENEEIKARKRKMSKIKRERRLKRVKKSEGNSTNEDELAGGDANSKRLDASRFRFLNEQLYTQPSTAAVKLFQDDPNAFRTYHKGYKFQLQKWPVNPLEILLMDLSALPPKSVVADLGCGEAELAQKLGDKLKIYSFDLMAANERVTEADMAKLPLSSESVDVCVYCLSLMGTNLAQFFKEAHRVLKINGKVKIVEIASRFKSVGLFVAALSKMGFQLKRRKQIGNGYFLMLTLEKVNAKIENKRPQNLKLEPCLYRKR